MPREGVKAEAVDGIVTLKGTVDWESNVTRWDPQAVEIKIASAFGRQASLDARRIHVAVRDSTAVLSGHVHSFAEERSARYAAHAAPGITKVECRLTIEP